MSGEALWALWARVLGAWYARASVRGVSLSICGLVIILCSAALWSGSPWRELQSGRAEYAQKMRQILALQKRDAGPAQPLNEDAEELLEERQQWMQRLPQTPQIAAFSRDLEHAARELGVRLRGLAPGRLRAESFYSQVPVQLEVEGGYQAMHGFLERLMQLPRAMQLSAAEFHAQNDGAELRVELLLQLYCCAQTQSAVQTQTHTQTPAAPEDRNARVMHKAEADAVQAPTPHRVSPFQLPDAAPDLAAEHGMEPVGSIRHGARRWRLLRDSRGRVHRIEDRGEQP